MLKKIKKCSYCGCELKIKKGKMVGIWEDLYKLLKKEPFSNNMQIQKEKNWKSWRKRNKYASLFSKKQKQKCRKKIEEKKKDFLLKVKIKNFDLDMQMDTGSEVMWEISGNALGCQPYERASYYFANLMSWS